MNAEIEIERATDPNFRINRKIRWCQLMLMLRGIHHQIAPKIQAIRRVDDKLDMLVNPC